MLEFLCCSTRCFKNPHKIFFFAFFSLISQLLASLQYGSMYNVLAEIWLVVILLHFNANSIVIFCKYPIWVNYPYDLSSLSLWCHPFNYDSSRLITLLCTWLVFNYPKSIVGLQNRVRVMHRCQACLYW